jgi:hypothetical protein
MNRTAKRRIPLLASVAAAVALSVSACGGHLSWTAGPDAGSVNGTASAPAVSSSQGRIYDRFRWNRFRGWRTERPRRRSLRRFGWRIRGPVRGHRQRKRGLWWHSRYFHGSDRNVTGPGGCVLQVGDRVGSGH